MTFNLSKKFAFTVQVVLDIALAADGPIDSRSAMERQGVPARYLEPVLQTLTQAGVLNGARVPKGGYVLGRPRDEINLADILKAVDATSVKRSREIDEARGWEPIVGPLLATFEKKWTEDLRGVTIERLCREAEKV